MDNNDIRRYRSITQVGFLPKISNFGWTHSLSLYIKSFSLNFRITS